MNQRNLTRKFAIKMDLELEYRYHYADGKVTLLSSSLSPATTVAIRAAIAEDLAQIEIFERLADQSAEQLSLFDTEAFKSYQ